MRVIQICKTFTNISKLLTTRKQSVCRNKRSIATLVDRMTSIPEKDRYLFDLNGYIVLKNVLTKEEVAEANLAIDEHIADGVERLDPAVRNTPAGCPLDGDGKSGRIDVGRVLQWGSQSRIFREILDHPKLLPYFHAFLGPGYRMDHMPFVIAQNKGSEGFSLHGGTIDVRSGEYNHSLAYNCASMGVIRCSLMAVSIVLSHHPPGSGGFCVVRGSHKSNFKAPPSMIDGIENQEFVYQPITEAGDVVLFSEGTVHGALPWNQDYQRRVCLYRFAPATCGYGRSYIEEGIEKDDEVCGGWPKEMMEGMTVGQKAVLQPPFATRLDRRVLDAEGKVVVTSRGAAKMELDNKVFGTKYF